MAVYHVIYTSRATERLSQIEILDLLKISRRKNEARGLTGMLLYRDGNYMQFLEGEYRRVGSLMDRLGDDPRHQSIQIVRQGELPERLFAEWSMAYKNLSGVRSAAVPGYSERLQGHYVRAEEEPKDPAQLLIDMFREMI